MRVGFHVKHPLLLLLLWDFNENWIFARDFRKILKLKISRKLCPLGAELFQTDWMTDGLTEMTMLFVAYCNFTKAPTICVTNSFRFDNYEGYSKINLRLVGKNKRVVIASKRTLSSNKELLFLLYPHTFSPRSVGVNTDKTWTLSSPLPPAVRYVLWFVFFRQKDKARPRFVLLPLSFVLWRLILE